MREQKAQRRRKPFQTTYQPSHCFHTGPSSRHEESNKVRHLLFCLKAAAITWGMCSLSIKNAVCQMFSDQRYYCRPKKQNVAFSHIIGQPHRESQPSNSFIVILKQQYVSFWIILMVQRLVSELCLCHLFLHCVASVRGSQRYIHVHFNIQDFNV